MKYFSKIYKPKGTIKKYNYIRNLQIEEKSSNSEKNELLSDSPLLPEIESYIEKNK